MVLELPPSLLLFLYLPGAPDRHVIHSAEYRWSAAGWRHVLCRVRVSLIGRSQLIGLRSFSGVLATQIFFYHHRYSNDHRLYKVMVGDVNDLCWDHLNLILSC